MKVFLAHLTSAIWTAKVLVNMFCIQDINGRLEQDGIGEFFYDARVTLLLRSFMWKLI